MIENNKRILKNAFYLYFQQFLALVISLYISRVVLNALGATDYGLYNVVGGVITLFSFVTNALSNSASRYLTYSIGTNDMNEIKRTFGSFLTLYYILSFIILIIGESLGLWFVYNYLTIPDNRFTSAIWVYHFSIVSAVLNIIYVPHNSLIIAHEKMSAFAYISIFDTLVKLTIALIIAYSPIDRLIFYSALILLSQIINRFVYIIYCKRHFSESSASLVFEKKFLLEIMRYSSWVLLGSLAYTSYTQGLNVLINIFFGPIVNAARGIAVQIQSATQNFIIGFQTAIYPQIVKSYAQKNFTRMYSLLHFVCKGSFFLFFVLGLPILLDPSFILKIWLKDVPDYTIPFTCCVLIYSMLRSITNEINHAVQATGNIKKFQFYDGMIGLLVLPTAYIAIKYLNAAPVAVFVILVVVEIAAVIVRIGIGIPQIGDSVNCFLKEVIRPIIYVAVVGSLLPLTLAFHVNETVGGFLLVCLAVLLWTVPTIFYIGLNYKERMIVVDKVNKFIYKLIKRQR